MADLLPCPICGKPAVLECLANTLFDPPKVDRSMAKVHCEDLWCISQSTYQDAGAALKKWNKRKAQEERVMQILENREVEDWDTGDRLTFALAGIARVSSEAVKDNLNPIRGFVDDYPTRLLQQLDHWTDQIREIEAEIKANKERSDR